MSVRNRCGVIGERYAGLDDIAPIVLVATPRNSGHIVLDAIQNVASSKAEIRFRRVIGQIETALKAHDMVLMVDPEGNYSVEIRD